MSPVTLTAYEAADSAVSDARDRWRRALESTCMTDDERLDLVLAEDRAARIASAEREQRRRER